MEPNPRRRGLTFSEVVLIILVSGLALIEVASVFLFSPHTALNAAKRLKAMNYALQIQTAALNYYTEYSVYPVPAGTTKDIVLTDTDSAINAPPGSWGPLMQCLCGMIKPSTGQPSTEKLFANARSIAFIQGLKTTDVSANDQPLNPLPPNSTSLYYNIAIDSDGDGLLGDPRTSSAGLLPSFKPPTIGAPPPMTGTSTAGVALWVNCNSSPTAQNSNFWRSTY